METQEQEKTFTYKTQDSNESTYTPTTFIDSTQDLSPVLQVLEEEDGKAIEQLRDELADNWKKKQIFRTETEMRISVLNDGKHPTQASKYWQSVREMSAHFDGLMGVSFDIKRNKIQKLKLERKLQKAIEKGDDLREMELRVDLEENLYHAAQMRQVAHDRVREIKLWSKIKSELDDGSFNSQDVNAHQAVSYRYALQHRVQALGPNSGPAEVVNAVGPLKTIERLSTEDGKLLDFKTAKQLALKGPEEYNLLKDKNTENDTNS